MAHEPTTDPSRFDDEETASGSLSFLAWGFTTVAALVLGVASWQYAPQHPSNGTTVARSETPLSDPEVTGSVARSDRAPIAVASRVVGADRIQPTPLPNDVQPATSRDIDQLRAEIRDLQRRIFQIGVAGDALSHRVDRLDGRNAGDAARGDPARPQAAGEAPAGGTPAADRPAPEKTAAAPTPATDRLPARPAADKAPAEPLVERLPVPRPVDDLAGRSRRPRGGPDSPTPAESEGPVVTGTIAKPAPAAPPPPADAAARAVAAAKAPIVIRPPTAAPMPTPAPATETAKVEPSPDRPDPAKANVNAKSDPAPAEPDAAAVKTAAAPTESGAPGRETLAKNDPAPTDQTAAPSAAGDGRAAIDLGGYRSLASLKRAWGDLSGKYSELGKGVEPLARLRETDSGIEARLLAGPFTSQTDAAKSCMRLRAAGVGCSVAGYSGQPLGGIR